jgi:hypothetical protein
LPLQQAGQLAPQQSWLLPLQKAGQLALKDTPTKLLLPLKDTPTKLLLPLQQAGQLALESTLQSRPPQKEL